MTPVIMQSANNNTINSMYNLEFYSNKAFEGFEFTVPQETMDIISKLAREVGSPTYVKTPVFHTRTNTSGNNSGSQAFGQPNQQNPQNRRKHNSELLNEDWETIRSFQATKIEKKEGVGIIIDNIRVHLNKLSDKNYNDCQSKIYELLDTFIQDNTEAEDILQVGNTIFDIASNNRFYSKLYADLYAGLIKKYIIMDQVFKRNYESFVLLFNNVECGDADKNYDDFCRIVKVNECRRALSLFFVNLMKNGILTRLQLIDTLYKIMSQMYDNLSKENKQNEVNELVEIIAILYNKELIRSQYEEDSTSMDSMRIDSMDMREVIEKIASSKPKTYISLSSKSKFKFMDIIDV
jgi:hypothetical protein